MIQPTISLCMIVKNEEKILERCLNHIYKHVDEIIIVDTGSTDKTIEIAKQFTNKVYYFKWRDDFSAARNFSISKATKGWILVLDADEFIDKPHQLKQFLFNTSESLFTFKKLNIFVEYEKVEDKEYLQNKLQKRTISYHERLFKNNESYWYQGIVHEQIFRNKCNISRIENIPNKIYHFKDSEKIAIKNEYYNYLGKKAIELGDTNCNLIINLLIYYADKDDFLSFNDFLNKHCTFKVEERMRKNTLKLINLLYTKNRFKEMSKINEILENSI